MTPDAGLPPGVVEPPRDPAWTGRLSRRRRAALRRLRARRLRQAARLMRRRRYPQAKKILTRVLAMTDDTQVRQTLSLCHQKAGELDASVYHLEKALARAPARYRPLLYDRLGLVLVAQKKITQACAAFDLPVAREIIRDALAIVSAKQRKNGTFGTPCQVERVAAALVGQKALTG